MHHHVLLEEQAHRRMEQKRRTDEGDRERGTKQFSRVPPGRNIEGVADIYMHSYS